jgi:hypothetical protein
LVKNRAQKAEQEAADLLPDQRRLQQEALELTNELSNARKLAARKTDTVMYRGTRRPIREAIIDTNGRIARHTAQTATRNASSVVVEAIPYLGIAAMLGVTTYDLKDSCDIPRTRCGTRPKQRVWT